MKTERERQIRKMAADKCPFSDIMDYLLQLLDEQRFKNETLENGILNRDGKIVIKDLKIQSLEAALTQGKQLQDADNAVIKKLEAALGVAENSLSTAEKYLSSCGYESHPECEPEYQMLLDFRSTLTQIQSARRG